ncbi:unnamed protein product [Paramecium pentaurelia]|uniref:Thioredoxin-like fold domain-containing protein n=1 Tax=Paramecium pentaurelia TaxID=43138 RepID=A0A8S1S991_9CILI|nr:unnamed protein product [Paramecium pentaurelia]
MTKVFVLISLFLGICLGSQYTPIPKIPDGLIIGDNPNLVIEAYYDIFCPGSRESYNIFKTVIESLEKDSFTFIIHQFPLPYHKNAFSASAGYKYIWKTISSEAAYKFEGLMLNNLEQFTDLATLNLKQSEVYQKIIDLVKTQLPQYQINYDELLNSMKPGTPENIETRYSWKYGTSRSVSGTPTIFVNGVLFDKGEELSAQQWIQYIQNRKQQN